MEILACYLTFLSWTCDIWQWIVNAFTVLVNHICYVIGLIGFALAIMIYYIQTLFIKRVSWARTSKGNHSWIILINGSKKILNREDISQTNPLTISLKNMKSCEIIDSTSSSHTVNNFHVDSPNQDKAKITFEYMEPGSFQIVEMETTGPQKNKPELIGYLNDGDRVDKWWWLIRWTHTLIHYVIWAAIVSVAAYSFIIHQAHGEEVCSWLAIILSCCYGCAIQIYTHLYRRIPYKTLREAKSIIKCRKKLY